MKNSRQQTRRFLFGSHFTKHHGAAVPKDLPSRKERRKLARAYAAGEWRAIGEAK